MADCIEIFFLKGHFEIMRSTKAGKPSNLKAFLLPTICLWNDSNYTCLTANQDNWNLPPLTLSILEQIMWLYRPSCKTQTVSEQVSDEKNRATLGLWRSTIHKRHHTNARALVVQQATQQRCCDMTAYSTTSPGIMESYLKLWSFISNSVKYNKAVINLQALNIGRNMYWSNIWKQDDFPAVNDG